MTNPTTQGNEEQDLINQKVFKIPSLIAVIVTAITATLTCTLILTLMYLLINFRGVPLSTLVYFIPYIIGSLYILLGLILQWYLFIKERYMHSLFTFGIAVAGFLINLITLITSLLISSYS